MAASSLSLVLWTMLATATGGSPPLAISVLGDVWNGVGESRRMLAVVAAEIDGVWQPREFLESKSWNAAETYKSDGQRKFFDAILTSTFHAAGNPSITFAPSAVGVYGIVDSPYIGIRGDRLGPESGDKPILMTNSTADKPVRASKLKDDSLRSFILARMLAQVKKAEERLVAGENPNTDRHLEMERPESFDPGLYEDPVVLEASVFDCAGGNLAWVRAERIYPKDALPEFPMGPEMKPYGTMWKEFYFAVFALPMEAPPVPLWENTSIFVDPFDQSRYTNIGVCDVHGDGTPEFVLFEVAHEHHAYLVFEVRDGKARPVGSASGSL